LNEGGKDEIQGVGIGESGEGVKDEAKEFNVEAF
jgi:hypothetical protein